jgi:membrane protein
VAANPLSPFTLVRSTFAGWSRGQAGLNAAALAFFTLLSLTPLLALTVMLTANFAKQTEVEGALIHMAYQRGGYPAAKTVRDSLARYRPAPVKGRTAALGIIMLALGASTVVLRLRASTNAMWGIVPAPRGLRSHAAATISERFSSAILTIAAGLVLLALLAANTFLATVYERYLHTLVPRSILTSWTMRSGMSLAGFVVLFAAALKLLPQAGARLRDLLPGAIFTALLFWGGTRVLSSYLQSIAQASGYDAVTSVVVCLLWIYYSAMIYLLGARFARVWATLYGAGIKPGRYMSLEPDPTLPDRRTPESTASD